MYKIHVQNNSTQICSVFKISVVRLQSMALIFFGRKTSHTYTYSKTDSLLDRQIDRQMDRQIDRQIDNNVLNMFSLIRPCVGVTSLGQQLVNLIKTTFYTCAVYQYIYISIIHVKQIRIFKNICERDSAIMKSSSVENTPGHPQRRFMCRFLCFFIICIGQVRLKKLGVVRTGDALAVGFPNFRRISFAKFSKLIRK